MTRQRIQLARASHVQARLRTGREFLLIVPAGSLLLARWDRALYRAGEEAALTVVGRHLRGPVEITVEEEQAPEQYAPVARLDAQVDAEGARANAPFRFPARPDGFAPGHLLRAEWGGPLVPGEPVTLRAMARDLDGEPLTFVVEEEIAGAFVTCAELRGTVSEVSCDVRFAAPAPDGAPEGDLASCAFESLGATAWLTASARGMEGRQLHFLLEREGPAGWVAAGQATATVKDGVARAGVAVEDA